MSAKRRFGKSFIPRGMADLFVSRAANGDATQVSRALRLGQDTGARHSVSLASLCANSGVGRGCGVGIGLYRRAAVSHRLAAPALLVWSVMCALRKSWLLWGWMGGGAGTPAAVRRVRSWQPLCDVCVVQATGLTALHAAVGAGHVDVADLLMDAGADINARAAVRAPRGVCTQLRCCVMVARAVPAHTGHPPTCRGAKRCTRHCFGAPAEARC